MKRDMDLVRKILIEIEKAEDINTPPTINADRYSEDVINYHIKIMSEAGLINLSEAPMSTSIYPTYSIELYYFRFSWG